MIHPTAIIHPHAKLGQNVEVGPFSIIDEDVVIGDHCRIESHVRIHCNTTLGQNNHIYHGAVIGIEPITTIPQTEPTYLTIGDHNVIREHVTLSRGTNKGGSNTTIGNHNLIMLYVHIGHDCIIGNHTTITGSVKIAGHVEIEDHVVIGGLTPIHQYCKIGRYAMVGGGSGISQDVVPFALVSGNPLRYLGLNVVGLRRAGLSSIERKEIKRIHSILFRQGLPLQKAVETLHELPDSEFIKHTLSFIDKSTRGLCRKSE
ncbi:acyl-ACP--UDP-N-acetylglucosamine O-acyltransferase [Paenibacillus albiflavus]|uniref:Acyl-ACP--UDP-N-acetylglucosamine O-acyltransferase n=2 Tax=Paenibacillus albiflavus TaxID=2545760 RepID=A0A4R4EBP2_9BACL|nr:acyl-ACP--UDP-N-acetylglucosamine O-acyltransferase [Paenibacillus albiflavus]